MSEYSGDSTQLLYLRARQYAPETGRFLTKDTWAGDENSPMSYNAWLYGYGSPVNYTDPSGHFPVGISRIFSSLGRSRDNRITYENQPNDECIPIQVLLGNTPISQSVSIIYVSGLKTTSQGAYSWSVHFKLDQPAVDDGWIVQEIELHFEEWDTVSHSWKDYTYKGKSQWHFWEAWRVKKGKQISSDQKGIDTYLNNANLDRAIGRNTVKGTVKFYTGDKKPYQGDYVPDGEGWGVWERGNSKTIAGYAASTDDPPDFWDYNGTPHNFEAYWNARNNTNWGTMNWGKDGIVRGYSWGTPQPLP